MRAGGATSFVDSNASRRPIEMFFYFLFLLHRFTQPSEFTKTLCAVWETREKRKRKNRLYIELVRPQPILIDSWNEPLKGQKVAEELYCASRTENALTRLLLLFGCLPSTRNRYSGLSTRISQRSTLIFALDSKLSSNS